MTIVAILLFFLAFTYFGWVRLHSLMVYFQQDEYDNSRFASSVLRIRLFDVRATATIILCWVIALLFGLPDLGVIVAAAAMAWIALLESRYRFKKPLAKTQRAKRIMVVAGLLMIAPTIIAIWLPLSILLSLQAFPLALMLANALLQPLQRRVNDKFIAEAEEKLARINPIRIGITGSFGKTTVKHMLADVLSASAPVFYSRGSINTKLGLTRHIRQRLQWSHRYFIAEMGAYGIGSIDRLCDFIKPNFGIVTAVGHAHTERFGSIDAIATAKSELVERVCASGGTAVIAADLLQFRQFGTLVDRYAERVICVGAEGSQVEIAEVGMVDGLWQITLRGDLFPKGKLFYRLPLLGDHNVMNSALALTLAVIIDPAKAEEFAHAAAGVEQIPHRLQKRDLPSQPLVLDDAYNSNETGFYNAMQVLRDLANERGGRAILVTPGIAELGVKHDETHRALGVKAAELCDMVIAVNPERIPSFVSAALNAGAKLIEVTDLAAARQILAEETGKEDVILYENDLPDLLEATRLL